MILKTICEVNQDELSLFTCGNEELDKFLKKYALKNDKNGYGKTFVLYDRNKIVGFFTLCSSSIRFDEIPRNNFELFPRYPIPAIKIARLAVAKQHQGMGYGKILLKECFIKILNAAMNIGVRLIVVDAKEASKSFYKKFGFQNLINNESSYFLLVDTLKESLTLY